MRVSLTKKEIREVIVGLICARTPKEAFSKSMRGNLIKIKKDETWERHGLGQTIYALRRVGAKRWNYYAEVAE